MKENLAEKLTDKAREIDLTDLFSPIFTPDRNGNPGGILTETVRSKGNNQDEEGNKKIDIILPSAVIFDPNP